MKFTMIFVFHFESLLAYSRNYVRIKSLIERPKLNDIKASTLQILVHIMRDDVDNKVTHADVLKLIQPIVYYAYIETYRTGIILKRKQKKLIQNSSL